MIRAFTCSPAVGVCIDPLTGKIQRDFKTNISVNKYSSYEKSLNAFFLMLLENSNGTEKVLCEIFEQFFKKGTRREQALCNLRN